MSLESAGAARSNAAVNFDRLAGAIEREAGVDRSTQAGAMEGRQVTVGLLGKDKPVKFEMMTNEMVQQFMKMNHEERQERIGMLQARLQEVKHNPNFSAKGQQANAKIQLAITVPMLVKQLKSEAKVNDFHEARAQEAQMKEASMKAIQQGKASAAKNANSLGDVAKSLGEKYMDEFAKVNMGRGSPDEKIKHFQELSARIDTQLNSPHVNMAPEGRKTLEQLKGVIGKTIELETNKKVMQQGKAKVAVNAEGLGTVAKALTEKYMEDFVKVKTGEGSPKEKIAEFEKLSARIQQQLDSGAPLGENGRAALDQMKQGIGQAIEQQKKLLPLEARMPTIKPPPLPSGEALHKAWNANIDKIVNSPDKSTEQKISELKSRSTLMKVGLQNWNKHNPDKAGEKATLQGDIERCESEIQKLISGGGKGGADVERQQAPERPKSKVLSDDDIAAQAYTAATSDPVGFKADAARDKLGNILYSSKPANEKLQLLHAKLEAIDDDMAVIKGLNKDADVKALQDVKQEFTTVIAKLKDEIYQSRKASMSAVVKGDIDFFVKDASTKTSQDMIGILNSANASGFGTNTLMRKYDADDAAIYDQGFTKAYCYLVEHSGEELLQPLTNIMSANNKVAEIRSELINQNLRVFYNNDNTVDPKSGEPLRAASKATENTDFRIVDDYNSSELSADQRQALGSAKEELLKLRNEIMPHVDALDKKDPVAQSFGGYPEININRMLREVRFLLGEISREEYRM
ncbi:hypothetical protein [Estrella lausannensis]|uniref:Uncharacterized protein n=1 Tax=Estrella lausannensis TaxID=483423 RepID=A0A0H5DRY7_9BACT|nr:hypothetical protein [Estrella lausannensis]CRX39407.1 hypothetical protein ELAC_2086 [Estrella lausannensis]